MNKTFIFFCISTAILALSIIVICISPIINNIQIQYENDENNSGTQTFSFSNWKTLNCKIFADRENSDQVSLDNIQKYKKIKTLCNRKKAMHDLEYTALIIDLALGFICANLSFLHYLNVGKEFEKKTGMIGCITGIIGFIITFVYLCYNAYIFNNDIAYGKIDYANFKINGGIIKLYPNGASHKSDGTKYITPYENEKEDNAKYIKYKELGQKQYNYDSKFYKSYEKTSVGTGCKVNTVPTVPSLVPNCEYIYSYNTGYKAKTSVENKDLYDKWLTTLILGFFIVVCNVILCIFGFIIFKSGDNSNETKTVAIV